MIGEDPGRFVVLSLIELRFAKCSFLYRYGIPNGSSDAHQPELTHHLQNAQKIVDVKFDDSSSALIIYNGLLFLQLRYASNAEKLNVYCLQMQNLEIIEIRVDFIC